MDEREGKLLTITEGFVGAPLEVGAEERGVNVGVLSRCKICASLRSLDFVVGLAKGSMCFLLLICYVIKCSIVVRR